MKQCFQLITRKSLITLQIKSKILTIYIYHTTLEIRCLPEDQLPTISVSIKHI